MDAVLLEGEWGLPIDPAAVAEALEREPGIEVVFVTQSETSTGAVSDLPALRAAAGDRITGGEVTLEVTHVVGHTPGSICLLYRDPAGHPHLWTGDCLFPGGPGRTTSPEDFTSLMDDLEERVFGPLPDETWVYPGHGDDTTLGRESPHLAEWRQRGW